MDKSFGHQQIQAFLWLNVRCWFFSRFIPKEPKRLVFFAEVNRTKIFLLVYEATTTEKLFATDLSTPD